MNVFLLFLGIVLYLLPATLFVILAFEKKDYLEKCVLILLFAIAQKIVFGTILSLLHIFSFWSLFVLDILLVFFICFVYKEKFRSFIKKYLSL